MEESAPDEQMQETAAAEPAPQPVKPTVGPAWGNFHAPTNYANPVDEAESIQAPVDENAAETSERKEVAPDWSTFGSPEMTDEVESPTNQQVPSQNVQHDVPKETLSSKLSQTIGPDQDRLSADGNMRYSQGVPPMGNGMVYGQGVPPMGNGMVYGQGVPPMGNDIGYGIGGLMDAPGPKFGVSKKRLKKNDSSETKTTETNKSTSAVVHPAENDPAPEEAQDVTVIEKAAFDRKTNASEALTETASIQLDSQEREQQETIPEHGIEVDLSEPKPQSTSYDQPLKQTPERPSASLDDTQYISGVANIDNQDNSGYPALLQNQEDSGYPDSLHNLDDTWVLPQDDAFWSPTPLQGEPTSVGHIQENHVPEQKESGITTKSPLSITLTVLSCIAALAYAIKGVWGGPQVLSAAIRLVSYGFYGFIPEVTWMIFHLLKSVSYLGMAVEVTALGFQMEEQKASVLLVGEGIAGIAVAVACLLNLLHSLVFYQFFEASQLLPILWAGVTIAVSALMVYLLGIRPLAVIKDSETGFSAGVLLAVTGETLSALVGKTKDKAEAVHSESRSAQFSQQSAQTSPITYGGVSDQGLQSAQTPPVTYNTSATQGQSNGGVAAQRLSTNRGLLIYILLSAVTFGIYGLYFHYKMAKDINIACAGDGKKTRGLLFLLIVGILTCGIYFFWWYCDVADRVRLNAQRYGIQITEGGGTFLLWDILIGPLTCGIGSLYAFHVVYRNVNRICEAFNRHNGLM